MWLTMISWGAKIVPFIKSPKGAASMLVLIGAFGLWLYMDYLRGTVTDLRREVVILEVSLDKVKDANKTNMETINSLKSANQSLADAVRIREEERIAAAREAAERIARAEIQLDDTLDTLEELRNETPDCEELSKIDMGAVCPAVTERLRQHAKGPSNQD